MRKNIKNLWYNLIHIKNKQKKDKALYIICFRCYKINTCNCWKYNIHKENYKNIN